MRNIVSTAVAAVLVSGCATITRGTAQDFIVSSTPEGAAVKTSNGFECPATPCTFRMPRKDGFTVELTLEGYEPAQATVTSGVSSGGTAGMVGNVLIGGLIGVGVDATSGAMNDLSPNPLHIDLRPLPEPEAVAVAAEAAPADAVAADASAAPVAVGAAVDAIAAESAPTPAAAGPAVDPAAAAPAAPASPQ